MKPFLFLCSSAFLSRGNSRLTKVGWEERNCWLLPVFVPFPALWLCDHSHWSQCPVGSRCMPCFPLLIIVDLIIVCVCVCSAEFLCNVCVFVFIAFRLSRPTQVCIFYIKLIVFTCNEMCYINTIVWTVFVDHPVISHWCTVKVYLFHLQHLTLKKNYSVFSWLFLWYCNRYENILFQKQTRLSNMCQATLSNLKLIYCEQSKLS